MRSIFSGFLVNATRKSLAASAAQPRCQEPQTRRDETKWHQLTTEVTLVKSRDTTRCGGPVGYNEGVFVGISKNRP